MNLQEEVVEGLLFEFLNNIRTVKVLEMTQVLTLKLLSELNALYSKVLKRIFWFQTSGYSRMAYSQFFQLCMIAFVVYGIVQGHYEVGFLVLFNSYFGRLVDAVAELADVELQ